jgi:hypothetical protein
VMTLYRHVPSKDAAGRRRRTGPHRPRHQPRCR